MAEDKTTPLESEQNQAERRVEELMGPAQNFDGKPERLLTEKPLALTGEPLSAPELGKQVQKVKLGSQVRQESLEDNTTLVDGLDNINAEPRPQVDSIKPESDLDMGKPPSDFTASFDDNEKTASAVDDIMHKDADAVLAAPMPEHKATVMKASFFERIKNAWFSWWYNPKKRYSTLAFVAVLLAALWFIAPVRESVLSTAGVRSSLVVQVFDGANTMPLQNATVEVSGVSGKTNDEGELKLNGIRLGDQKVQVSKAGFSTVSKQLNFGFRVTQLGDITLQPTGKRITYKFTDYVSGKPVADVAVSSGEATAKSDKQGKALLTLPPSGSDKVKITKKGYRTETIKLEGTSEEVEDDIALVASQQAIFVTKESGKYDVYKMYVDGTERKVLFSGTGLENASIFVRPSQRGDKVIVGSTRDDKRNKDGYLLTALNIVDVETGDSVDIEHAEQITPIGWYGETFVYSQVVAGASAANPNRSRIIAYNITTNKRYQLGSANYFTGSAIVGKTVYYTVSATDPAAKDTFIQVDLDGTVKKSLHSGTVWSLLRVDYEKFMFQTPDKWYAYTAGASQAGEVAAPPEYDSRLYVDSQSGKQSVWVDKRDKNGVLMLHSIDDMQDEVKDKELHTQSGMAEPAYWLNDSLVVYRVQGATEVAEYVISVDGGEPKKISDVSNPNRY